jgi:hypothetical protein
VFPAAKSNHSGQTFVGVDAVETIVTRWLINTGQGLTSAGNSKTRLKV